jgi:hypothetical protein
LTCQQVSRSPLHPRRVRCRRPRMAAQRRRTNVHEQPRLPGAHLMMALGQASFIASQDYPPCSPTQAYYWQRVDDDGSTIRSALLNLRQACVRVPVSGECWHLVSCCDIARHPLCSDWKTSLCLSIMLPARSWHVITTQSERTTEPGLPAARRKLAISLVACKVPAGDLPDDHCNQRASLDSPCR